MVEYGRTDLDIEHARTYGPNVVLYQLTELGRTRLLDRNLPPNLPHTAYRVLAILGELGYAEEDEIANYTDLTPKSVQNLVARLIGFGYVQQVSGD